MCVFYLKISRNYNKQRRKSRRHERSLIREFRYEIMIGVLFFFGVFLLIEDMEIKGVIYHGVVGFFNWINQLIIQLLGSLVQIATEFETSDIVGSILVMIAVILLIGRVREKVILRYSELTTCPDCNGKLNLIHRNLPQKFAGKIFFVSIRHYKCKDCEFEGVRVRRKHAK